MNKRYCENCGGIYATGKNYGDFWQEFDIYGEYKDLEKKGLCELCNEKSIWYIGDKSKLTVV